MHTKTKKKQEAGLAAHAAAHYLFESGEFRCMLNVAQVGVLACELLSDMFELWMLHGQDQAGMVAQLTEVLQRLEECSFEGKDKEDVYICINNEYQK